MAQQHSVAHIRWYDTPGVFGGNHANIPPNAFILAEDVDFSRHNPRRLGGRALLGTPSTAASSGIRGGYDWDRDGSSQQDIVVTVSGTVWMETASGSGSYVALVTGLSGFGAATAGSPGGSSPKFVEGGLEIAGNDRKLFMFSRLNPVYVLTGTGATMATIAYPTSDWKNDDYPIFGCGHDGRIWAGGVRANPHRIYYSDDEDHEKFTTAIFSESVKFDGASYLARGADLTGSADSQVGFVSFWVKFKNGTNHLPMYIIDSTGSTIDVHRTQQNKFRVRAENSAGTTVLSMTSKKNYNHKDGWIHFAAAWNLATPEGYMRINGVDDLATGGTFTAATIDYTVANHYIGAAETATGFLNGKIQQLYLNTAEFLDISESGNMQKLYDNGAVSFGATGNFVTDNQPIVYMFNTATWSTNLGSGGNYTLTGSLSYVADVPPGELGGDPGSFNVFPGFGSILINAVSLKGWLVCFKRPGGVFAINTQDLDPANWSQQVLSHTIALAYPKAAVIVEGELVFMSSDGDFHAVSIIQNDEQSEASITEVSRFDQWIEANTTLSSIQSMLNSAVYSPDTKTAMFDYNLYGHTAGSGVVCIDFNQQQPRFYTMETTSGQHNQSVWLSRDSNNVFRPVVGSVTNGEYYFFPSATTYGTETTVGSVPVFNMRTPNMDFHEIDESLADKRKNGRWLEIVYEPCTGTATLAAEIFWDGNSYATITFPIAASTGIGYARRRLNGAGRTFGARIYHPLPSTTTHAFALSGMNVYFSPGAASPT